MSSKPRICFVASIPLTLWTFYRPLFTALQLSGFSVEVVCSSGPDASRLRDQLGLIVHEINLPRAITPLTDTIAIARLSSLFRRRRFDIVHAHTPKGVLIGIIAATIARVPHRIVTLHGLPLETEAGLKRSILLLVEKIGLGLCHHAFAVSPSLRQRAIDLKLVRPKKISVLGRGSALGVDLDRFRADPVKRDKTRSRLGIRSDETVIGFVGRLVPDKGVELLVEWFSGLSNSQSLRLLVVGDFEHHRGALSENSVNFVRSHPQVIYVPHSDTIEDLYAVMDILVLPTAREGFGCVLMEAAACGVPAIASRVTGCVDAVEDSKTGLLFSAGNLADFEEKVNKLLSDPAARNQLGETGRARAEQFFSQDSLINAHLEFYRNLCDPAVG